MACAELPHPALGWAPFQRCRSEIRRQVSWTRVRAPPSAGAALLGALPPNALTTTRGCLLSLLLAVEVSGEPRLGRIAP